MNFILITAIIVSMAFGAIGDSRYDYGKKFTGKLFKDLEVLVFLFFPLIFVLAGETNFLLHRYASFILGYIFVRFALFDIIYAISRPDIPWDYIGSTGWYGWVARQFAAPSAPILFARVISLTCGLTLLIKSM